MTKYDMMHYKSVAKRVNYYLGRICTPNIHDDGSDLLDTKRMIEEIRYFVSLAGLTFHQLTEIPTAIRDENDEELISAEDMVYKGVAELFDRCNMDRHITGMMKEIILCRKNISKRKKVVKEYFKRLRKAVKDARIRVSNSVDLFDQMGLDG